MPQPGPSRRSDRAGQRLVHLHRLSGPALIHRFKNIITANASSVYYTSRLEHSLFQIADDIQMMQMTVSRTQPYSAAKPSVAGQVKTHYPELSL